VPHFTAGLNSLNARLTTADLREPYPAKARDRDTTAHHA
jgi:hypothetical protein